MKLTVECEHGEETEHVIRPRGIGGQVIELCEPPALTDPDAIIAHLVAAGWLESERSRMRGVVEERFVTPWKEATR